MNNSIYTEDAGQALTNAPVIAQVMGSPELGTEHLLIGLLSVRRCTASKLFFKHAVDKAMIANIDGIIEEMKRIPRPYDLPLTPRAKRVLMIAKEIAIDNGHNVISSEHMMIAFFADNSQAMRIIAKALGFRLRD